MKLPNQPCDAISFILNIQVIQTGYNVFKFKDGSSNSLGNGTESNSPGYLSVEFCSVVEEGLADVMHAICVAGRVLQAGESTTAHLEGTVQASDHFSYKERYI